MTHFYHFLFYQWVATMGSRYCSGRNALSLLMFVIQVSGRVAGIPSAATRNADDATVYSFPVRDVTWVLNTRQSTAVVRIFCEN
jgi:hypothetical protein